jgi:hypothetical protein
VNIDLTYDERNSMLSALDTEIDRLREARKGQTPHVISALNTKVVSLNTLRSKLFNLFTHPKE